MPTYPLGFAEDQPMRPLVEAWTGRLERAREHKKPWQEVADDCEMFYSAACGFLWDPQNRQRFWGNREIDPTFRITLARPFEVVALMGPSLYWDNPERQASPNEFIQPPPQLFGDIQNDPQAQQAFQQEMQAYQAESMQRGMAATLQQTILNKTSDLLGLVKHSRRAVVDMLLMGRGILETAPFRHPGSRKLLIRSSYLNPSGHYVDPDCEDVDEAWYHIVERHEPYWEVERKFGLYPRGVLKNAAKNESASKQGALWGDDLPVAANSRTTGDSRDMVTYFEAYSRMGVGLRDLSDTQYIHPYARALEQVAGDNCYCAFCPGIPYFLNCPDWVFKDKRQGTVDAIRQRFAWPIPYWTEAKYPFSFADAYPRKRPGGRAGYPYPLSPLASGIGELKAINILMCSLLYSTWMSSRTLVATLAGIKEEVEAALKGTADWVVIPGALDDLTKNINEAIQFVQQNPQTADRYKVIAMLAEALDRRWGLNDLLYGQVAGAQDRSATATQARQANTSIRPQDLSMRIGEWQREVARREAYGLWYTLQPGDLTDVLGSTGARMWGQFVKQQPGERIIRQIDYRIEATPMKRPDLARDSENLKGYMQVFGPLEQWYIQATGHVEPFNALKQLFGKTTGMKMDAMMFQPPPPPDPSKDPAVQAKQMELQLEQAKAQLDAQIEQMKAQQQLAADQAKAQQQLQAQQQQTAIKQSQGQQDLVQDQQQHVQEMQQDEEKHRQEMIQLSEQAAAQVAAAQLQLRQKQEEGRLNLRQKEEQGRVQVSIAKRQAAVKPKPASANGRK